MIECKYYPEHNFILTIMYDEVTPQQLHNIIDQLQQIDHNGEAMRGLTIICESTKTKGITAKDIMSAGERMKQVSFRKNGKNAIIAKTLLSYGLSRMYQVATDLLNLDELKVYKEKGFNDAVDWLNILHLKDEIKDKIKYYEDTINKN